MVLKVEVLIVRLDSSVSEKGEFPYAPIKEAIRRCGKRWCLLGLLMAAKETGGLKSTRSAWFTE